MNANSETLQVSLVERNRRKAFDGSGESGKLECERLPESSALISFSFITNHQHTFTFHSILSDSLPAAHGASVAVETRPE